MAANERGASSSAKQTIEQLQTRYEKLNTKKIQAETHLTSAETTLKNLQDEARQKFGTDDVAELRKQLEAMKAENENKRAAYQASLDAIDNALQAVETNLASAEAPPTVTKAGNHESNESHE